MKHTYGLTKYFCWLTPLLLLLAGCATTIPEIKPFADKTAEMAMALNKGYSQAEVSLTEAENEPDAKQLQKNWAPTKKALSAVVAYSDSLAAIADAGNKGSDSAKAVATSLNGLITAVNPLVGLAQLPEQAVKTMEAIYSYVAKVKARESMANAVGEAQPAIEQIADVMAKNFDDLANLYASAGKEQERRLIKSNQELYNYYRSLSQQKQIITTTLINILDYQNAELGSVAKSEILNEATKLDAPLKEAIQRVKQCEATTMKRIPAEHLESCKDEPSVVENRQNQLLVKWHALQDEIDRVSPEYSAYAAKETALRDQIASGNLVIKKCREAIIVWRDTHAQIKRTLEQKQRMTIQQLATVIKDMTDVYNKGGK